jgi:hypothetical protein
MSLIREVAGGISRFVVRHASPGSKEWAEGLAREADFVESDWKAFAWSLGSMRVLFSYREAPLRSLDDLSTEAGKYAERMRHRFSSTGGVWIVNLIQTLCWIVNLTMARDLHHRVGYFLIVSGFITLTIHTLILSRETYDIPDRDDPAGMVQYYKTGLKHSCSLNRFSFVATASFIVLAGAGLVIVSRGTYLEFLIGFVWIALLIFVLQKRQSNLRKLEEIEMLLRERS